MGSFLKVLDGRKMYLVSGILFSGVLLLIFLGRLTPTGALPLLTVAGFAFGFRNVLEKHHGEALALMVAIGSAGVAAKEHNKQAEIDSLMKAAEQGAALAKENNS